MPNDPNLHKAASNNEIDVVRELLDVDRSGVNEKDEDGFTPLFYAVRGNDVDLVDLLIRKGSVRTQRSS